MNSLESLERRFGALPSTVESRTGGGGRHLYFEHPGYPVRNRTGIGQGIDLRGDGGYVVAPPSLHPSGEHYAWRSGCSPEERTLAPLPRWLLTATGIPRSGRSLGDWRKLVQDGVPEGQRNSTIASLTGHLLWHGVDAAVVLELLLPGIVCAAAHRWTMPKWRRWLAIFSDCTSRKSARNVTQGGRHVDQDNDLPSLRRPLEAYENCQIGLRQ